MGRFRFLFRGLIAFALLAPVSMIATAPVSAGTAAATTTCSNGVDNTPGLGLICQVTIVNTITGSGGSAKVTIHECHGAAGAPTAACTTKTTTLSAPVTVVNQCNNSIGGGGGTLRCSVTVTSNFYGGIGPGATAATVDQCVRSGGGITTGCGPTDMHRDRHDVLGRRGHDQPVQRLGQWRRSPGHMLRQPGQQGCHHHTTAHRNSQPELAEQQLDTAAAAAGPAGLVRVRSGSRRGPTPEHLQLSQPRVASCDCE